MLFSFKILSFWKRNTSLKICRVIYDEFYFCQLFFSSSPLFRLKVTAIFSLDGERWLIFQMFQPGSYIIRETVSCKSQWNSLSVDTFHADGSRKTYTCKLHQQSVPVRYFQHTYTKEYREEVELSMKSLIKQDDLKNRRTIIIHYNFVRYKNNSNDFSIDKLFEKNEIKAIILIELYSPIELELNLWN